MKNKTKKRVGIVAMMLLLIVAIAATAGTTLAKYISSATITSDSATVAQWGYTVSANTAKLFSNKYNANKIVTADTGTVDVKADAEVVAPGTSNNSDATGNATLTINGTAQVDAQLVIKVNEFKTVFLKGNAESGASKTDYYPLMWDVNGLTVAGGDDNALATAIASAINAETTKITGTTLNATATSGTVTLALPVGTKIDDLQLKISWKWLFTNGHDVEDTVLGALANLKGATPTGTINTSADDGNTVTTVDLSKYSTSDYNLTAKIGLSASVVQTTNANS